MPLTSDSRHTPTVTTARGRWLRKRLIGWLNRGGQAPNGFAVRMDWQGLLPGTVCHDFSQFTTSLDRVRRRRTRTARFWAHGPVRPLAVTVVPIDRATFKTHRQDCTALTCPTTAALHRMGGGDAGQPH